MSILTTEPLEIKEVSKLPRCTFCSEEATKETADDGMKIVICGTDNHPEYEGVKMVDLKEVAAE